MLFELLHFVIYVIYLDFYLVHGYNSYIFYLNILLKLFINKRHTISLKNNQFVNTKN